MRLLPQLWMRPQVLLGAHRPRARHPQRPGPRGLRLQVAPPHQPNVPTGVFGNLGLSSFLSPLFSFFCVASFSYYLFAHVPPSGPVTTTGTAAVDAAVEVTPGLAPVSEPRTPEGVPEDVVEYEGKPELAPELVPEVVQEEALAEGAMNAVHTAAAPLPSRGA
jgi:hypothetical protein